MKTFILLFCFGINRTLYAQSIDNQLVLKPDSVDFQSIRDAHAGDACVAMDFKRRVEHPSENLSRKMDNLFTVQPGQRTISPAKVSTTDWFLERNAANSVFDCGRDAPNAIGNSGSSTSGVYLSVADSSYQLYTQDPEAYIWMLEKQVYESFADLPFMAQTTIMQTYLNQKQGTEIETFYQLKKGFESLFTKDPVREARLKELNTFMENWATQKYESNNEFLAEDATLFAKNKEYQNLMELEKQSTNTKAQALLQLNATLPDEIAGFFSKNTGKFQRPYVFYEKVLNRIYLSKVMEGTVVYTEKEKEVVKKIALMCPLIAGEAPMKARTLYKHFIDPIALPEPNCQNVPKTAPKQNLIRTYKVFPNPTTGLLNITSEFGKGVFDWELCTVTGIVLKSGTVKNDIGAVDMSNLSNGLYLIKITEPEAKSIVIKVVLTK